MRHDVPSTALQMSRRGGVFIVASVTFALGLVIGATLRPSLAPAIAPVMAPALPTPLAAARGGALPQSAVPSSQRLDPRHLYPADVLRVIDGDTFEARVRVWPGLDVDTKVRLRGIDAPELHARCSDELVKAQAARAALETILAEGGVAVSRVGIDKYGGRVDAVAATRNTADVSSAMLNGGWARSYNGGRRGTWC
jgi:endonuclease YncB( thermonuclease family)